MEQNLRTDLESSFQSSDWLPIVLTKSWMMAMTTRAVDVSISLAGRQPDFETCEKGTENGFRQAGGKFAVGKVVEDVIKVMRIEAVGLLRQRRSNGTGHLQPRG